MPADLPPAPQPATPEVRVISAEESEAARARLRRTMAHVMAKKRRQGESKEIRRRLSQTTIETAPEEPKEAPK